MAISRVTLRALLKEVDVQDTSENVQLFIEFAQDKLHLEVGYILHEFKENLTRIKHESGFNKEFDKLINSE